MWALLLQLVCGIACAGFDRWYRQRPDHLLQAIHHLSAAFRRPLHLLRGMGMAPFVLAGPRALEYFVKDSCKAEDSWDFYTYSSASCVGLAMKILSESGVVWDDALQPLRDMAGGAAGEVHTVHIDHLTALLARAEEVSTTGALDVETGEILRVIRRQYEYVKDAPNRLVRFPLGACILILHDADTAPEAAVLSAYTISGYTTAKGSRARVRLVFKPDTSPMQHILAFPASSMQCSITPFGAFHLYHSLAVKRQVIVWHNNLPHTPGTYGSGAYWGRPWRVVKPGFASAAKITDSRLSISKTSKYIPLSVPIGLPENLHRARKRAIEDLKWEVSENETRLTVSERRSLRKILATHRRARRSRDMPTKALTEARELAIKHSVAFGGEEDEIHPNEVSGV